MKPEIGQSRFVDPVNRVFCEERNGVAVDGVGDAAPLFVKNLFLVDGFVGRG